MVSASEVQRMERELSVSKVSGILMEDADLIWILKMNGLRRIKRRRTFQAHWL